VALDLILSPIRIGTVEIPNRVVRSAHGTGFANPDITDQFIDYHAERAKGGCGLSILEAASVHSSSKMSMALHTDTIVGGYKRLMAAVNPYGMRVFQQLWHGGNLYPGADGPPLAVSARPSYSGIVGRPMSSDEVEELIAAFVAVAHKCREGGLHGVEVHAAHGYIFQQFLSPLCNDRDDQWGGDFAGRSRFLMETLRAIRAELPGFPLGVRLSASEAPLGITDLDNRKLLQMIQSEALIDFVSVSGGDYFRMDMMVGTMHNPTGYELPSATQTLTAAKVPRMVAGRFRTLEEAEQIIRDDTADLVSMVRAQIADPQLVNKSRAGNAVEVRPCVACNQGCIGGLVRVGQIGCLVNPAVGAEATYSENLLTSVKTRRHVLIVGGGPSGMEAARIAATRGHRVTLAEASSGLGGQINIAKRAPKLHTLGDIAYWLEHEVYRLGVEVCLNTFMDADDIRAQRADVVIIAAGSMPRMDGFINDDPGEPVRGTDLPHVMSSIDVMTRAAPLAGTNALVLDTVGHYEALAVCEQLLSQGLAVTLLSSQASMSPYVQTTWRDVPALERFYRLGNFTTLVRHRLIEIRRGRCIVRPSQAGLNQWQEVAADIVVLVTHNQPLRDLYDLTRNEEFTSFLIGDALSPRDVQAAIADGHRVGRALD
jgi:2,4-dienoyl-CoA reductase-like NADH-dependent reductase (Old Yellow Enzyme family)